ncbi:MAG: LysR family transcriptional regulator [Planctomycetes bacterium]|nr:LysR family transcriptional regulator [Planctomycetota bacterium]
MDTTQLHHFLLLAQLGNMTRTAATLNLTQPALSGQIKRLESELGATLFHRQRRGLVLTPAGETLRRAASDALATLDGAREQLAALGSLRTGSLAIGGGATSTTCLLPAVIGRFHAEHPGIRFAIREAPSRTIVEAVLSGELDLGVVTLPIPSGHAASALEITPWLVDELVLLVPPDHPLGRKRRFLWKDLHNQPLIAFESGSAVRQLLDRRLAEHGVTPALVMELRAIASITSMVASGIGLGFISRLADADGRGLRCGDQPLTRQLAVVERKDRARSAAVAAFRTALLAHRV